MGREQSERESERERERKRDREREEREGCREGTREGHTQPLVSHPHTLVYNITRMSACVSACVRIRQDVCMQHECARGRVSLLFESHI